jgi:NAD(P)H-quinone oxidoreductase subunit 5
VSIAILPFLAPIALIIASVLAFRGPEFRPARDAAHHRDRGARRVGHRAVFGLLLILNGPATSGLIGIGGLGLSARLDAVSAVMLVLVTFVGWVVLRFAATYMDGEAAGQFTGWLCATLAAVMLLVIAGNTLQLALAWIATSVFLHKLLLFYPERVAAQRAARKKWVVARAGDAALIVAVVILYGQYGTGDIATILPRPPPPTARRGRPGSPLRWRWPRS